MDKSERNKIFDFIFFSSGLRGVERHNNGVPGRKESVAEHSWHLALICWVLHSEFESEFRVKIDLMKMLKMCLMHDLVEIDTGDPSAWNQSEASKIAKAQLEAQSAKVRFQALPSGLSTEFSALWSELEDGVSLETILVKAVDRLNPALMRYLTGQGWSDVNVTAEQLDQLQLSRIKKSEVLTDLYYTVRELAIKNGLLQE